MQKLLLVVLGTSALAAALALAAPARAGDSDVAMRVQDVPLGPRSLAATAPAIHFNMVALHWRGAGSVLYRTKRLHGGWRPWTAADADVSPDGGTGAWHDGDLDWVGASSAIQYRTRGAIHGLRSYELWSRVTTAATRTLSEASSPKIVSRSGWHANEEIVRAKPSYAPQLKLAIVHHTAGTNNYTPAQAAAIVRGIEVYHVEGNGWNDIGYNFLVDRFGTVYEGRAGGMTRNVIGAHAEGFNTGSVGVALIGNFQTAQPTVVQQDALVKLLAWRLDLAHIDPLSTVALASRGNAKYRAGKVVVLRAISGHRDTGPSECPGNDAYALLPSLAKRVAATGLPKIYSPTAAGALGGPIRFQARLSAAAAWTVTIANGAGKTVAAGHGTGTLVDWTWHAPRGGKTGYRWTISTLGARPVTGTFGRVPTGSGGPGSPAPPQLSGVSLSTGFVAPVGDDATQVVLHFTLSASLATTVQVVAPDGTTSTLESGTLPAGANTVQIDAGSLADGVYRVIVAPAGLAPVTETLTVDRTLTGLSASSGGVSPNGDGIDDTITFSFTLSQPTSVQLTIDQNGSPVATPFDGVLQAGSSSIAWDGTGADGTRLPEGAYVAMLTYSDALGTFTQSLPVTVDVTPPLLTVVDPKTLTFTLSEVATVTFVVNGGAPIVQPEPAGTFSLPYAGTVSSFSARPQDGAGNLGAPVTG
jgi:hypothetical protein